MKMFLTTLADVCYTGGCNPFLVSPAETHEEKDEFPAVAVCKSRVPKKLLVNCQSRLQHKMWGFFLSSAKNSAYS